MQPKQAAMGGQRPKLQLQPRSKPAEDGSARQSSLFGAARTREEILKVSARPTSLAVSQEVHSCTFLRVAAHICVVLELSACVQQECMRSPQELHVFGQRPSARCQEYRG